MLSSRLDELDDLSSHYNRRAPIKDEINDLSSSQSNTEFNINTLTAQTDMIGSSAIIE